MPPGQEVTFEPALTQVLAEHFHHSTIRRDVIVDFDGSAEKAAVLDVEYAVQSVRIGLVRAEHAEVRLLGIARKDVPQQGSKGTRRFVALDGGSWDVERIAAESRQVKFYQELAAVGVRIGAHSRVAPRCQCSELRDELPVWVKQFLRLIRAHPRLERLQVVLVRADFAERHLMGAPRAFDGHAVDLLGPRPSLRRRKDDHRPARAGAPFAVGARCALGLADLRQCVVEGRGDVFVHDGRVVALDDDRRPAVAAEQLEELLTTDARRDRGVGDLPPVELEDGQHGTVARWVQELVRVPAGGQRPGLGLAVAHDACHHQIGVVEGGAEGMGKRIAQFAALVDGAWRLWRGVARDAAGEGELPEQSGHAPQVLRHARVDVAVGPLQPGAGHHAGPTVAGAGDEDHVEVVAPDQSREVGIEQVEARRGAPMPEEPGLDVLGRQRLGEQRVVEQIDLPDREVVRRPPPGVDLGELGFGEGSHALCPTRSWAAPGRG